MQILITKKASKELERIYKGNKKDGFKIQLFLDEVLAKTENAISLQNAKKLQGYEKHYRWRIGDYRIIGIVENEILSIEIIKIAHRKEAYDG